MIKYCIILLLLVSSIFSKELDKEKVITGKQVFETYCWGCHHQTAVAFGPPFSEIASKRSPDEIRAMITDPESVSKVFKYKRNAMPKIPLNHEELEAITKYILSYKDKN